MRVYLLERYRQPDEGSDQKTKTRFGHLGSGGVVTGPVGPGM